VPLLHAGRLVGVLNLSNKHDGECFGTTDLERAELAGALLAATLARRAAPTQVPAPAGRFEVRGEAARAA
jgi:hypothetical protein